jgi:hypothetical protein
MQARVEGIRAGEAIDAAFAVADTTTQLSPATSRPTLRSVPLPSNGAV